MKTEINDPRVVSFRFALFLSGFEPEIIEFFLHVFSKLDLFEFSDVIVSHYNQSRRITLLRQLTDEQYAATFGAWMRYGRVFCEREREIIKNKKINE
jgi:hypothetical protein